MPRYKSKKHSPITDEQAQVFGSVMDALEDESENDLVTAEAIVKKACPKSSPIHDLFEWDNSVAAHAHRIQQARLYVAYVDVIITVDRKSTQTKGFHNVTVTVDDDTVERGYVSFKTVRANKELSTQVIRRAQSELNRWRRNYEEYEAFFGPVMSAIDKSNSATKKLKGRRRRK